MSSRGKVRFATKGKVNILFCPDCSKKIENEKKGVAVLDMLNHGRKKHKWSWTEDVW